MFSRAAKSVVKSVGSHRIYTGEKNFKIALIGGAREISQTLSQLLRNNVKPNVLALYDVAAVNKPFYNFYHEQPFKSIPSEMSTMRKKSCLEEGNRSNTVINSTRQTDNNNHQGNNGRNQTEKLVEALYRLPIAEEVPALNSPLVPIEELMSKASNACSRMRLYARVLGETSSNNMKTWQRDYATVPIRKWFFNLTYHPSFQEYTLNFIPEAKIVKKDRSMKKTRKFEHLSYNVFIAKENNHQLLPTFLLNHGEKPARRLMKKFRNVSILPNMEACCKGADKSTDWLIPAMLLNIKLRLLHEFYGCIKFPLSSLNFINYKHKNNREVISFNRDSETMTNDTLNVVEQKNWIRRTCSKIKSILPDLQAKMRFHSTTASDLHCSENIFVVNQVIPFSNIISNNPILFASKDCEDDKPKAGIRRKIQEFCMQRKKTLKKNREKNDICKKRGNSCEKKTNCSGRITADKRQNVVSCKNRNNSCNKKCSDPCKSKKNNICGTKKDSCERKVQEDPCKKAKDDTCSTKDPCKSKKHDICGTEEEACIPPYNVEEEPSYYDLFDHSPCRLKKDKNNEECGKKKETKKPDCSKIKKVDCEKKTCSSVKKIPECSDDTKGKNC